MSEYRLNQVCPKRIHWVSRAYDCKLIITRKAYEGERYRYTFRFWHNGKLIFRDCLIGTPCMLSAGINDTPTLMRRSLIELSLTYVTLREGDTDSDFFNDYTPIMRDWIAVKGYTITPCEQLSCVPYDMQENKWDWRNNTHKEERGE